MAHPDRIEEHVAKFRGSYQIPDFFARKRIEEELRQSRDALELRVAERTRELREAKSCCSRRRSSRRSAGSPAASRTTSTTCSASILMRASLLQSRDARRTILVRASSMQILRRVRARGALTQQLLAFSRAQVLRSGRLDLGQLVREPGTPLQPLVGEDIELDDRSRSERRHDRRPIASQIEQVHR